MRPVIDFHDASVTTLDYSDQWVLATSVSFQDAWPAYASGLQRAASVSGFIRHGFCWNGKPVF